MCKLFARGNYLLESKFRCGFDCWKNVISRIQSHEHSKEHLSAISVKLERQKCMRIDIEFEY